MAALRKGKGWLGKWKLPIHRANVIFFGLEQTPRTYTNYSDLVKYKGWQPDCIIFFMRVHLLLNTYTFFNETIVLKVINYPWFHS